MARILPKKHKRQNLPKTRNMPLSAAAWLAIAYFTFRLGTIALNLRQPKGVDPGSVFFLVMLVGLVTLLLALKVHHENRNRHNVPVGRPTREANYHIPRKLPVKGKRPQ